MKYQETMKLYVKNIAKNQKNIWRPIYEVIDVSSFVRNGYFPQYVLDWCKINPNRTQFLPYEVKVVLKNS